jgi:hypothetical protein
VRELWKVDRCLKSLGENALYYSFFSVSCDCTLCTEDLSPKENLVTTIVLAFMESVKAIKAWNVSC